MKDTNPSFASTYQNKMSSKTVFKDSKSITTDVKQFGDKKVSPIIHPENYTEVLRWVMQDEELRAFISILRDSVIRSGFNLKGENKKKVTNAEKFLKKVNFKKKYKRMVSDLIIFKHAFMEVEKGKVSGKALDIHMLDPAKIKPVMNIHGKVLFWYQDKDGVDVNNSMSIDAVKRKGVIAWETKELIHISIDEISPTFWGFTDIYTLRDIILMKSKLQAYMSRLLTDGWMMPHLHSKTDMTQEDLDKFLDMLATHKANPEDPLLTMGSEDLEGKRYITEDVFIPLIELGRDLRNKMLTLLRVPPIIAGTVDNSNRSNSDVQANFALLNRVRAIQEDMEDDLNHAFFTAVGFEGVEINFAQSTNRDLKEMVDIMVLLIGQMGKREVVIDWARSKGYDLPEDLFPTEEEIEAKQLKEAETSSPSLANGEPKGEASLPKNSNLKKSRKPQDKSNQDGYGIKKD